MEGKFDKSVSLQVKEDKVAKVDTSTSVEKDDTVPINDPPPRPDLPP